VNQKSLYRSPFTVKIPPLMVFMKKHFYLLFTFLIFFLPSFDLLADSIAGGKMEITHVSGDTYKIMVTLFVDETPSTITGTSGPSLYSSATMPWMRLYAKGTNAASDDMKIEKQLTFESKQSFPYDGIECVTSKTLATQKIILSTTVTLPSTTFNNALGYYIVYQDGYRNPSDNILQSKSTGITLYTEFPSLTTSKNSSPVFKLQKGIVACVGKLYSIDLGADDADGNTRSYISDTPYSGPGYLTLSNKNGIKPAPRQPFAVNDYVYATWIGGFAANSAVPGLTLNASTGVLSGTPTKEGTFVVTVECREFRGATQIGVVRQDVEIRVEKCVPPEPKIYVKGGNPAVHVPVVFVCEYSFRVLETADLTLATYKWFKNGVQVTGATKNTLKIPYAEAGKYTVEVTRTGACSGTTLSQITDVVPQGGVNIKLDIAKKDYCVGESFIINVTGLPLTGGSVNKWYKDGVLIPNIPFPANSYPVGSAALKDSGFYRLEVTANAGNQCVYEDSVRIKIIPIPKAIITNVTGKVSVCQGEIVKLQATKEKGVTYYWVKDGADFTIADNIDVTASGTYGLRAENGNCFDFASPTVTIKVNPFPTIRFDEIKPVCNVKGGKIDLINLVKPDYDGVLGKFSGKGVTGSQFDPAVSGYGSFPIKYTYTTPEGCSKDASQTVVVDLTPVIKLGNDFTIFRGDTARIKSVGSVGSQYTYEWYIAPVTNPPSSFSLTPYMQPQPLVNPPITSDYKVKVISAAGKCPAEDKIRITVRPKLKFANAFTPNNDAINDTWEIEGIGEYPNAEVTIFNRWGGEMFYSIGYNQSFDGIQKNERLPSGTYFYVIKPSPDVPTLTGYLTIVR
jgi:gliding motility-associated-like protein